MSATDDLQPRGPRWYGVAQAALFAAVTAGVVSLFVFAVGGAPGNDGVYHFRYAALYAQHGLWQSAFPWLSASLVSKYASDIGYGFHLLLIPFTVLSNQVLGVQVSALFAATLALTCFYLALRRHAIPYAAAWPAMLFFLGPPIVYTFLQTRPQTLTMGFGALLLSCLVTASPWGALAAAFAISFTHLNIALIILPIVLVAFLARGLSEKSWAARPALFALAGMVLGWLARPNPLGALKIEYVQTVVHSLVRKEGVPLLFGREWPPISLAEAATFFPYFLACWVGLAVVVVVVRAMRKLEIPAPLRSLLWSSLALSLIFFALTVLNTKRGTPLWASFAVLFAAAAFAAVANLRGYQSPAQGENARLLASLVVGFLLALMVWEGANQFLLQRQWKGGNPYRFQAAAAALTKDSHPGDIVYNVDWGYFPELFFWNTKDYYVSGLDPIFLYAYNRSLYWEAHHLQNGDTAEYTYNRDPAWPRVQAVDTYTALTVHFRARYVVLETQRWPALYSYLKQHQGVTELYGDGNVAVMRLGR